jgi:V-type H+-transporting ATPase subunit C
MAPQTKYLFVAVPSSVASSGHKDDAIDTIQKAANPSNGTVSQFSSPDFKIGTLDALIQQSEELSKLEGLCKSVVSKVGDTLKNVLDGDQEKMAMHKTVNDSRCISWN